MKTKWIQIIGLILVFQVVGILLGLITQNNIPNWYQLLNKPDLTPHPLVFSIVWPILYTLLAIAGYVIWRHRQTKEGKIILYLYTLQLFMNWAWTPLFFHLHWIGFSFFWLIVMTILTILIIYFSRKTLKNVSLMLIPYCLWLVFATYLNGAIWILNA